MKKAVMKKMMAGLCTAAMLVSCTMGVLAADIELDPSEETRQRGDTEVYANVTDNDNKPDYLIGQLFQRIQKFIRRKPEIAVRRFRIGK